MKKLTRLNNEESKKLLSKYEHIIYLESRKKRPIPGVDAEDLEQICREKILANIHKFDSNKSSEKTWICKIIKNAIGSKRQNLLRQKRINHLDGEISFDIPLDEEHMRLSEFENNTPEDLTSVLQTIAYLKKNLPEESQEIIKRELPNSLWEKIIPSSIDDKDKIKNKNEILVSSIFSSLEEGEIKILTQIADTLYRFLFFEKRQIIGREFTEDVVLR